VQGRHDRLGRKLPPDIKLTQAPAGAELGDMLGARRDRLHDDGEQSAVVPPRSKNVRRLFPNYAEVEKDYYRRTKIYPIMHTVVVRRDVYERDPWVAMKPLSGALPRQGGVLPQRPGRRIAQGVVRLAAAADRGREEASSARTGIPTASRRTGRRSRRCCNTPTKHGLTDRRLKIEELFAPATLRDIPLSEGQHV